MEKSKKRKCYVVIELPGGEEKPRLAGVFYNKTDAEKCAYKDSAVWRNICESTIE